MFCASFPRARPTVRQVHLCISSCRAVEDACQPSPSWRHGIQIPSGGSHFRRARPVLARWRPRRLAACTDHIGTGPPSFSRLLTAVSIRRRHSSRDQFHARRWIEEKRAKKSILSGNFGENCDSTRLIFDQSGKRNVLRDTPFQRHHTNSADRWSETDQRICCLSDAEHANVGKVQNALLLPRFKWRRGIQTPSPHELQPENRDFSFGTREFSEIE